MRPSAPPAALNRRNARPLNAALARQREALAPEADPKDWRGAVRQWAATPDRIADLRAALAATTELLGQVNASLHRDLDRFSARLGRLEAEVRTLRAEQDRLQVVASGRSTPLLSAEEADHRFTGRLDALERRHATDQDRLRRLGQDIQAMDVQGRSQMQALASSLQEQLADKLAWIGVEVDGLEVRLDAELQAFKARGGIGAPERG